MAARLAGRGPHRQASPITGLCSRGGGISHAALRAITQLDILAASQQLRRLHQNGLLQQKGKAARTYFVPTDRLLLSWRAPVAVPGLRAGERLQEADRPLPESGLVAGLSGKAQALSGMRPGQSGMGHSPCGMIRAPAGKAFRNRRMCRPRRTFARAFPPICATNSKPSDNGKSPA